MLKYPNIAFHLTHCDTLRQDCAVGLCSSGFQPRCAPSPIWNLTWYESVFTTLQCSVINDGLIRICVQDPSITKRRPVGWVERSATHQVRSRTLTRISNAGLRSSDAGPSSDAVGKRMKLQPTRHPGGERHPGNFQAGVRGVNKLLKFHKRGRQNDSRTFHQGIRL